MDIDTATPLADLIVRLATLLWSVGIPLFVVNIVILARISGTFAGSPKKKVALYFFLSASLVFCILSLLFGVLTVSDVIQMVVDAGTTNSSAALKNYNENVSLKAFLQHVFLLLAFVFSVAFAATNFTQFVQAVREIPRSD